MVQTRAQLQRQRQQQQQQQQQREAYQIQTRSMLRRQQLQQRQQEQQDVEMMETGEAEAEEVRPEDADLIHVERLDEDEYIPNEGDDDSEGEDDDDDGDEDILEITDDDLNFVVAGIEEDGLPQAENQLPLDFIRNPGTLLFYFFLGIYTGDGFHNQANTLIGIGFKSTYFAYLYNLLTFCGVPQPRFRFYQQRNYPSIRYGAGTIGGVRWGYMNATSARTLFRYGLPSSNILNSQPDLMAHFLPLENTLDSLMVLNKCGIGQPIRHIM